MIIVRVCTRCVPARIQKSNIKTKKRNMNKKFYVAPESEEILIDMEAQLLAGSDEEEGYNPDSGDPVPIIPDLD